MKSAYAKSEKWVRKGKKTSSVYKACFPLIRVNLALQELILPFVACVLSLLQLNVGEEKI